MSYLTANLEEFLNIFPQFNTPEYSGMSGFYFNDTYYWACDEWDIKTFKSRINMAIYLMTAHRLTLNYNAQKGLSGQGGKVSSATVGSVSTTFESIPNSNKFDYWLSLSPYGLDLLGLLETLTACPEYTGGSITRVF